MQAKTLFVALLLFLFLLSSSSLQTLKRTKPNKPCKRLVLYFHDIIYNGENAKNATPAIVAAPSWANKTKMAGLNHFGDVVVFDDPITLDNNLPREGTRALLVRQERGLHGVARVLLRVQLHRARGDAELRRRRSADEQDEGHISVIGGTGDFFMARGVAT